MCRLKDCHRVDGLKGSIYYIPLSHWTRITKYYLAHYGEWSKSPQGRTRLKRAVSWFLSHLAERPA